MNIITNNVPRALKYGYEMPAKFRSDFDYIPEDEFDGRDFVEYRGDWYDMSEFMRVEFKPLSDKGWQGYISDSFFSGIVVKYCKDDADRVIVGTYIN